MGAKDKNGNWGYVHDETALRWDPPVLNYEESAMKQACHKCDKNYRILTEQVFIDKEYSKMMVENLIKTQK